MATYQLRRTRILPALFCGAVVGAVLVAVGINLPYMFGPGEGAAAFLTMTFIVALVIWALGLMVVGGLVWGFSESAGRRSLPHAVIAGLGATFLASIVLGLLLSAGSGVLIEDGRTLIQAGQRTAFGWWILLRDCGALALVGGVVAAVIWRIAYCREPSA